MKREVVIRIFCALGGAAVLNSALAINALVRSANWTHEPRVASGEWTVQVQIPPCKAVQNMEVLWPQGGDSPITIECNELPVGLKVGMK